MTRILTCTLVAMLLSASAQARDTVLKLPFAEVLAMPEAHAKLDGSVRFFLAGQPTPTITNKFGEGVSNRKTNGAAKSDVDACRWAALSALIAFQDSAKLKSANAVINLVSYYKKVTVQSATEYECHAGGFVVGVALKGEYASLAN
jgi:uncharacterized protein YbjQ (UPF0145 family)